MPDVDEVEITTMGNSRPIAPEDEPTPAPAPAPVPEEPVKDDETDPAEPNGNSRP